MNIKQIVALLITFDLFHCMDYKGILCSPARLLFNLNVQLHACLLTWRILL